MSKNIGLSLLAELGYSSFRVEYVYDLALKKKRTTFQYSTSHLKRTGLMFLCNCLIERSLAVNCKRTGQR